MFRIRALFFSCSSIFRSTPRTASRSRHREASRCPATRGHPTIFTSGDGRCSTGRPMWPSTFRSDSETSAFGCAAEASAAADRPQPARGQARDQHADRYGPGHGDRLTSLQDYWRPIDHARRPSGLQLAPQLAQATMNAMAPAANSGAERPQVTSRELRIMGLSQGRAEGVQGLQSFRTQEAFSIC